MTEALILLPRLQVQNANAISGPLTWGFPSPTAFAGFVHALERRLADELEEGFGGVGIICHHFDPQVSRPAGKYTQVFQLTRNPLGKDGKTNAIVEEGRAHMEVSLVIALLDYLPEDEQEVFKQRLMGCLHSMRLAGGSLLPQRVERRYQPQLWPLPDDALGQDEVFRKLRRRLLPGFALVQREDRLAERLDEMREDDPKTNTLEALLDLSRLNIEPDQPNPERPGETQWGIRKHPGWLVPIPTGYNAISPLYGPGEVANARDEQSPFRFVESLYSLGEWVSPHRLICMQQLLWYQQTDSESGLYRCINHYSNYLTNATNGNT